MTDTNLPPPVHNIEPVKPSRTTRITNKVLAVGLGLAAMAVAIMLYWLVEDVQPLEVKNSPFPARVVADPSGKTGGLVFLSVDYCKNTNTEGQLRVSYVSESREQFTPITPERLRKGCDMREVPVVVPTNLSEDVYTIRFRATYDINPLKRGVAVEFESQPVNIGSIKNEEPGE